MKNGPVGELVRDELAEDPRKPFTEVAKQIGVSDKTVRNAFDRMVADGIIKPALLVRPEGIKFAQIRVMENIDSVAARFAGCPRILLMAKVSGELIIWFMADEKALGCEVEKHFPGAIVDMQTETVLPGFVEAFHEKEVPMNRSPCGEFCTDCTFREKCPRCPATAHFRASSTRPDNR